MEHLQEQHVDAEGTFEELRLRFVQLVRQQPQLFTNTSRRSSTDGTDADTEIATPRIDNPVSHTEDAAPDIAKIMNQIRKWGCHFNSRDPHPFLEQVEELSQIYGYPGKYLLQGLPEMLRGEAVIPEQSRQVA